MYGAEEEILRTRLPSILWMSLEWTFKSRNFQDQTMQYTLSSLSFLGQLCLWFQFSYSIGHRSSQTTDNK